MTDAIEVKLSDPYATRPENAYANKDDTRELSDCIAHNRDPYAQKHTVHPFSRAGSSRVVSGTLYQLKSGPRSKKFLGANIINFGDIGGTAQTYIASEAPYHADDYYRMVLDTGAKTLVSLTTDTDVYSRRKRHPVDVHHLAPGKSIKFDTEGGKASVTCNSEFTFASPYPDTSPIIIKKYTVRKPAAEPYDIHHIVYKHWADHGNTAKRNDTPALVAAINQSQKILGASPVAVNCGYGQGRTNALIDMHQMAALMQQSIKGLIPEGTPAPLHLEALKILQESLQSDPQKINVDSFIAATHARVMPLESAQPPMLEAFPALLMDAEVKRFAREHNLSVANPSRPELSADGKKHATEALKHDRGKGHAR